MNADAKKFEIIVIHGDNSESQHKQSFPEDAPWIALPFDAKKNKELYKTCSEGFVPCFQIYNFEGKRVLGGRQARPMLRSIEDPNELLQKWIEASNAVSSDD